ncbi:MAG: hypothetical protein QOK17_1104 [Sphingomonadales bacterium]|nr:hypothetical protein [Sphingomonadales bacterium]
MRAAQWRSWSGSLAFLPFEQAAFDGATASAARHALGLRAGDTLHLALAPAHGCKLVTLDQRLAKAAVELSVPVAEM